MMKEEIAIMVRVPVAGQVKTRLIAAVGGEGACSLYRAMVGDLLGQAKATGLPIHLFFTGGTKAQLPRAWQQSANQISLQQGDDLGARMAHALATCFKEAGRVVLIGSDIPALRTDILLHAFEALATHAVVLNPAMDGGYCLLGLNRGVDVSRILCDMPWSTDQVLTITCQRLAELGHCLFLLPPLGDIDTAEDLRTYQKQPNPLAHQFNQALTKLTSHP
ncbi:MAG: TIGR04282 family arsenosugar biosynthesis glycosyltransferase [Desulfobulbus sp.]|nr:TIGR04282 family arsenosugar biosynthesis glycosyltransferase [Desulfobulbus sp.]